MSAHPYNRGSEWRKWDLHIHTPLSIVEHYGGDTPEIWEQFISDLEALPSEFKVIGINDYLFIDGFEKVISFKKSGRLKNIELILSVLEFRLNDFAGVDFGRYARPNLHVIFSDEVSPSIIRSQFLATLDSKYKIEKTGVEYNRTIDRQSLIELGKTIIASVPEDQKAKFHSELIEGFNNLNLSLSQIQSSLEKDCFKSKYLLAIGKTEWDALKWSEASIASKKHLINSCDIVFTSAESVEAFHKAKIKLQQQNVKDLLLDCSDAHIFSERVNRKYAATKDRLGKCFTWIKADPTFEGLKQILYEPENRIFVGDVPPLFDRVRQNSTKYIDFLTIKGKSDYRAEYGTWFEDIQVPINKELVAIIGNKGNGKSAVSDIIGVLGNSHNNGGSDNSNFSFLTKRKFLEKGYAENFLAKLKWVDGTEEEKVLNAAIDLTQPEKVRYLPQSFFEAITNDLEGAKFEEAIKNVIFSHIPVPSRLKKGSFSELADYKTLTINKQVEQHKQKLTNLSNQIIDLEKRKHPKHLSEIEGKLKQRKKEQKAHERNKPRPVQVPKGTEAGGQKNPPEKQRLKQLNKQLEQVEEQIRRQEALEQELTLAIEDLGQFEDELQQLTEQVERFNTENQARLNTYKIDIHRVIKFKASPEIIAREIQAKKDALQEVKAIVSEEKLLPGLAKDATHLAKIKQKNLTIKKAKLQEQIDKIAQAMSKPAREHQKYLESLKKWQVTADALVGDITTVDTLRYLEAEKNYIETELVAQLNKLRADRVTESLKIFQKKKEIIDLYNLFKQSIDAEIAKNGGFSENFPMSISVSFRLKEDFNTYLLSLINKNVAGSFKGTSESDKFLNSLIEGKDLLKDQDIESVLTEIISSFDVDKREKTKRNQPIERQIGDQISKPSQFYQYLFSLDYLVPLYELKFEEKNISQLSPGEKGALLLVFYLMIDKEDIPLIIDQPEDNLDNQSVYKILTHFIRAAKLRRQIIIVTHNPNLAVGSDAEQVIYANLDKSQNHAFSILSGSIENKQINQKIVDILEGTMPAFDRRRLKYQRSTD